MAGSEYPSGFDKVFTQTGVSIKWLWEDFLKAWGVEHQLFPVVGGEPQWAAASKDKVAAHFMGLEEAESPGAFAKLARSLSARMKGTPREQAPAKLGLLLDSEGGETYQGSKIREVFNTHLAGLPQHQSTGSDMGAAVRKKGEPVATSTGDVLASLIATEDKGSKPGGSKPSTPLGPPAGDPELAALQKDVLGLRKAVADFVSKPSGGVNVNVGGAAVKERPMKLVSDLSQIVYGPGTPWPDAPSAIAAANAGRKAAGLPELGAGPPTLGAALEKASEKEQGLVTRLIRQKFPGLSPDSGGALLDHLEQLPYDPKAGVVQSAKAGLAGITAEDLAGIHPELAAANVRAKVAQGLAQPAEAQVAKGIKAAVQAEVGKIKGIPPALQEMFEKAGTPAELEAAKEAMAATIKATGGAGWKGKLLRGIQGGKIGQFLTGGGGGMAGTIGKLLAGFMGYSAVSKLLEHLWGAEAAQRETAGMLASAQAAAQKAALPTAEDIVQSGMLQQQAARTQGVTSLEEALLGRAAPAELVAMLGTRAPQAPARPAGVASYEVPIGAPQEQGGGGMMSRLLGMAGG